MTGQVQLEAAVTDVENLLHDKAVAHFSLGLNSEHTTARPSSGARDC